MLAWIPLTILGIAFWPFVLGAAVFIFWWVFLTYEPTYKRNRYGNYDYEEYGGGLYWGLLSLAMTGLLVYALMDWQFSWDKIKNLHPEYTMMVLKFLGVGFIWAWVRWPVQAWRGRQAWDRNAQRIANDYHNGNISKLTPMQKYELSEKLPKFLKYRWRFLQWIILWPISLLDTVFRDLLKIIWEWFTEVLAKFGDWFARRVYGHRYVPVKPQPEHTPEQTDSAPKRMLTK